MPRTPSSPSARHSSMATGVSVLSLVLPSRTPTRSGSPSLLRPGWNKPRNRADLFLIGPIQGDRGRILMEPGGRDGIHLQGVERERTKHVVEIGGKQGIEDRPQPVIMKRGSRK